MKSIFSFLSVAAGRVGLKLAALLGGLLAGPAFAAGNVIAAPGLGGNSAWTIYAFGNAQAVADAMRALANFTSSGTFQSIVGMLAVIGVIAVGLSSGFNTAVARKFIGYIVAVFMVSYVFFGVNNGGPLVVKVEVFDTVDGTWVAPVTVPAVVGIPAALISTAGYEITRQIEASFTLPDELKMSKGAPFNLAASMISDASQAKITDSNLASSFSYYVQDCFTIGVARGELQASSLISSTDFLNDIRFNNVAVNINTLIKPGLVGTPSLASCADAWSYLNDAVNAQGSDAAGFLKQASAWARTPALSVVNSAADTIAQWSTNNGISSGGAMVKQAAVLSTFKDSFRQAATATGNSDFLTGLAVTQAQETQRNSWVIGAEIFNRTMGYIFAILQVFVYSITPLMLAAALIPGLGLALLKNFGQILLWLAIWQPMLAIVNFIILSMQQADLGGILNNGNGAYGFTLQSMGIISEKTANMRAAATFVGTMVPALAWAMVKGSVDFSRIIASAAGEQVAAQASNTATTGNYSLNQGSMDSFTANKHSIGNTGNWGHGHTTTDQGSAIHKATQGGPQGTEVNGGAVKVEGSKSTSLSDGKALTTGTQAGVTGAHTVGGGQNYGDSIVGGTSTNGVLSTNAGRNAAVQVSGDASASINKPGGHGGGGGGGGGDGQGAQTPPGGVGQHRTPGQQAMDWAKAATPTLRGSAGLNGASTSQKSTVHSTGANSAHSGTVAKTGSDMTTASETASKMSGATGTRGVQNSTSITISGPGVNGNVMDAANAPYQRANSIFNEGQADAKSALGRLARGDRFDDVSQTAQEVADPRAAMQPQIQQLNSDFDKRIATQGSEAERLAKEAEDRKKKAEAESLATQEGAGGALAGYEKDSKVGALAQANEVRQELQQQVKDEARRLLGK